MKCKLTRLGGVGFFVVLCLGWGFAQQQGDTKPKDKEPWQDTEIENHTRFWTASVPGGVYKVALGHILSISKQTYILDANLRIEEVNVDTAGNALVRFYYIEPIVTGKGINAVNVATERGKQVLDSTAARVGTNGKASELETSVIKQYPTTSHSKTIEYRLSSSAALNALYGSVDAAWTTGRERVFTAR